jgi:hypothetical protein
MRARMPARSLLAAGAACVVAAMTVIPGGLASAAAASPAASGARQNYIVVLHDQNAGVRATSPARAAAARRQQAPVAAQISSMGARVTGSASLLNAVFASMTASQARALAASPAVAEVVPDGVVSGPAPLAQTTGGEPASQSGGNVSASGSDGAPPGQCGTASDPQLNPEALYNINAVDPGADGAGVKVATIADGLDPADADFQRNAAFASSGSPAGSPVVTLKDFSGDPAGTPTGGAEAYIDASAIAAQGNSAYDLSQFVNPAHPLPAGCDIKIQGVAPGASLLALKAFSSDNESTDSALIQSISYAVANGAKVINESFGGEAFPDTASADLLRITDDAAVAAGVTVVVATGDGGSTNTISSPATDPNVISVGASTTFRAFTQGDFEGINDPAVNQADPKYADDNVASISSGGITQSGRTLDLVAPGDSGWSLCNPDLTLYTECMTEHNTGAQVQLGGGTSQAAPFTAGAAADVIQAYAAGHGGKDPSPKVVKQVLLSTATDIDAPADMQGAGLLNVRAAVQLASTIGAKNGSGSGGLALDTDQVDVTQNPRKTSTHAVSVTNTSATPVVVHVSTRALTNRVGSETSHFCLQPSTATASCPANTGVFPIWSGVEEVYQNVSFTVPATSRTSQLKFSADYSYTGQTSALHVSLIEPDGTFAAASDPQGLAGYASVVVANPPAGKWTAVFFTAKDDTSTATTGTSGNIQWNATTTEYAAGSSITPDTFRVLPGQTGTARLRITSPSTAGDQVESVVVSTPTSQTTVPVVIRTLIPTNRNGGSYRGVFTGGDGRAGVQAQANDYEFNVPRGAKAILATVTLATDPGDVLSAQLIAPDGENLGYSSNVTFTPTQLENSEYETTRWLDVYHASPAAGRWTLELSWAGPITGRELSEQFSGTVSFAAPRTTSTMPHGASLKRDKSYSFKVTVRNSGKAGEWVLADARKNTNTTLSLFDQNPSMLNQVPLPVALPNPSTGVTGFPYYLVPTLTSRLEASASANVPVNFQLGYMPGDPELEGVRHGDSASLSVSAPQISPGLWALFPTELGPYGSSGAVATTATVSLKAVTRAFDQQVTTATGNAWLYGNLGEGTFNPVYIPPGAMRTIKITVRSGARAGSLERGTLYIEDFAVAGLAGIFGVTTGDVLTSVPYSFRVGR